MDASVASVPDVVLEFTDPTLLGVTLENPSATELIAACALLLGRVALEPNRVRLVITGDFVESVRQRLEDGPYRDSYGLGRNTGVVAGKTMRMPDGSLDVVMPDMFFEIDKTPVQRDAAYRAAVYTVLHEGQHVAMTQAGETDPNLSHLPWGRRSLENVADQVIQEYRAERALDRSILAGMNHWDLAEVLTHWHAALVRIASVEYQEHLDVHRLWHGVVQETQTAWKLLAYLAAALADGHSPKNSIREEVWKSRLWRGMVKPHWHRFVHILAEAPPGDVRTPRADLEAVRRILTDEFDQWLHTLGFEAIDTEDGFAFYIRDWSLLEG